MFAIRIRCRTADRICHSHPRTRCVPADSLLLSSHSRALLLCISGIFVDGFLSLDNLDISLFFITLSACIFASCNAGFSSYIKYCFEIPIDVNWFRISSSVHLRKPGYKNADRKQTKEYRHTSLACFHYLQCCTHDLDWWSYCIVFPWPM